MGTMLADCWEQARWQWRKEPPRSFRLWPEYHDDPVGFFVDVLGAKPWEAKRRFDIIPDAVLPHLPPVPMGQADLLRAVAAHPLVAVVGGKGCGKTWDLGRLPLWWLHTRENAMVVTVATTGTQVVTQVWGELEEALLEALYPLGGRLTWAPNPRYSLGPRSYAIGMAPRKPESIQGFHAKVSELVKGPVLVLADEISGVDDPILDALDGLTTTPGSQQVWSTNAKRASGRGFELWHPPMGSTLLDAGGDLVDPGDGGSALDWDWHLCRMVGYDAPPWVIGDDWFQKAHRRCGPDLIHHPVFRYDALALFPEGDSRLLFPLPFLEACLANRPTVGGRQLGVDVGRQGTDPCIAILSVDGVVRQVHRWSDKGAVRDTMRTAGIIRHLCLGDTWMDRDAEDRGWEVDPRHCHIDAGGLGQGVVDALWDMGLPVDGVEFGKKPEDAHLAYWKHVLGDHIPDLPNMRQSMHWVARTAMQDGLALVPRHGDLSLLWDDLTHIALKDQDDFRVMTKAELRKTIGRSTDYSDAWVLTFSRQDSTAVRFRSLGQPVRVGTHGPKPDDSRRRAQLAAGRRARARIGRGSR